MDNAYLKESWQSAIGNCAYKFTELHPTFHHRASQLIGIITRIMIEDSTFHVFDSAEGLVWMLSIDFEPFLDRDIKNLEDYALAIYKLTGIPWTRILYEGLGWDIKITEESVTTLGD